MNVGSFLQRARHLSRDGEKCITYKYKIMNVGTCITDHDRDKRLIHPLVREGVPQPQNRNALDRH
jgi:hypothetical protein